MPQYYKHCNKDVKQLYYFYYKIRCKDTFVEDNPIYFWQKGFPLKEAINHVNRYKMGGQNFRIINFLFYHKIYWLGSFYRMKKGFGIGVVTSNNKYTDFINKYVYNIYHS